MFIKVNNIKMKKGDVEKMKDRIRINIGQNNEYMEELIKYIDINNKGKEEEMIKKDEEEQWGKEVMESDRLDKEVEIDMYDRRGSDEDEELQKLASDEIDYSKTYKEEYLDSNKEPMDGVILEEVTGKMEDVFVDVDEEYFESDGETEGKYDPYTLYSTKVIFESKFECVGLKDGEEEFENIEYYAETKEGEELIDYVVNGYDDLMFKENLELYYGFEIDYSKKVFRIRLNYSYTETNSEAEWHDTADRWEDDRY
jgi:hypothetical protein